MKAGLGQLWSLVRVSQLRFDGHPIPASFQLSSVNCNPFQQAAPTETKLPRSNKTPKKNITI